jgi:hypothetical protein
MGMGDISGDGGRRLSPYFQFPLFKLFCVHRFFMHGDSFCLNCGKHFVPIALGESGRAEKSVMASYSQYRLLCLVHEEI